MGCKIKGFSSKSFQREYKLLADTTNICLHYECGEHVEEKRGNLCLKMTIEEEGFQRGFNDAQGIQTSPIKLM